jgi:uncharacterized protein YkwD
VVAVDAGRTRALVSAYRQQNGLGPVRVESRLMQAAAAQARAMGSGTRWATVSPGPCRAACRPLDIRPVAPATENLDAGIPQPGTAAMQGWKASPIIGTTLLNPDADGDRLSAAVRTPGRLRPRNTYWALILASRGRAAPGPARSPSPRSARATP